MAKAKQKTKDIEIMALKTFTKSTVIKTKEKLQNIKLEDLIPQIYFKFDDEDLNTLSRMYEKVIILSKVDFEKFKLNLHHFFIDTHKYIKENNLYQKFFKLAHYVYIDLCKKGADEDINNAYFDILVQQYAYFGKSVKIATRAKDKGLEFIPEIGKGLTEINYLLRTTSKESVDVPKLFGKYGHKVKSIDDVQRTISYDQVLTNMVFSLAYFMYDDENYKIIFPRPFKNPVEKMIEFNVIFAFDLMIDTIKETLTHRQYLLPPQGVVARYTNCGEIVEVTFKETIMDERVIMLWKAKFEDETYIAGYYDTFNKIWYDPWKESSHSDLISLPLQNMILQSYIDLTCNIDDNLKSVISFFSSEQYKKIVESMRYPFSSPEVIYEVKNVGNTTEQTGVRKFDRDKYRIEFKNVNSFLRKLPIGASASDEAREYASRLGIELPNGYTFVQGFRKKVYKTES